MPIDISCPGCNRRMSVPEAAAGRQVKCPGCQTPVVVPTAAPVAVPSPAAAATSRPAPAARPAPAVARPAPAVARAMPQAERWTLLTEDQQQFGPIARVELDQWYAEGRITQSCQLLREGGAAWQWATDVYPALAGPAMMSQPANEFDFGSPAANPYAPSKPTKSSVSKYTRRSAAVDYVSYACFAVIGLIALNILMGGLMQHSQISDRVDPGLASASLAVY